MSKKAAKIPSTDSLIANMVASAVADQAPASAEAPAEVIPVGEASEVPASEVPASEAPVEQVIAPVEAAPVAAPAKKSVSKKPAAKSAKVQKGKAMNAKSAKSVSAKVAAVKSANQGLSFGQWAALLGRVAFQKGVEFKGAASAVEADLLAAYKAGKGVREVLKAAQA